MLRYLKGLELTSNVLDMWTISTANDFVSDNPIAFTSVQVDITLCLKNDVRRFERIKDINLFDIACVWFLKQLSAEKSWLSLSLSLSLSISLSLSTNHYGRVTDRQTHIPYYSTCGPRRSRRRMNTRTCKTQLSRRNLQCICLIFRNGLSLCCERKKPTHNGSLNVVRRHMLNDILYTKSCPGNKITNKPILKWAQHLKAIKPNSTLRLVFN